MKHAGGLAILLVAGLACGGWSAADPPPEQALRDHVPTPGEFPPAGAGVQMAGDLVSRSAGGVVEGRMAQHGRGSGASVAADTAVNSGRLPSRGAETMSNITKNVMLGGPGRLRRRHDGLLRHPLRPLPFGREARGAVPARHALP